MKHDDLRLPRGQGLIEHLYPCLGPHHLYAQPLPHPLSHLRLDLHPTCLPQGPIDRERCPLSLPCQHPGLPSVCKGIQIGVGSCIVGLSHVAHHCCHRRAQDEEVQGKLCACLIQPFHPDHFGRKHCLHFLCRLVEQETIAEHPRCVDNPIQAP